jgi:hypothetical protein
MATVQNINLNTTPSRAISTILTCFQAIFMQETFSYAVVESNVLQINCQKWGDIGKIVFLETLPGKTEPRFEPPQAIAPDELPKYEKLIREECLGPRGRLAELVGRQDIVNQNLIEALYEKRLQRQQEFTVWLFNRLQIFGYRGVSPGPVSNDIEKIDEQFDFPIKGTPAQFGVMFRQFALALRALADYRHLALQILLPGSRKDARSIFPDANPIEIQFSLGKNQLSIQAHVLPVDGTLLRIRLIGDKNLWVLWDKIRDELEKLGWFSLVGVPFQPDPGKARPESQLEEKPFSAEVWINIPDIGANREILRLWHQGLTCTQIAARIGLTEKTVLNRINKLRKEFGAQIVPYRKSNFIKKSEQKSS